MSQVSPVTVSNEREIQPMQLSLEQLNSLKGQHEQEIQELSKQMESLYNAKNRYMTAKSVISDISACPEGNTLMVPLNSSLYVPGRLVEPSKVMPKVAHKFYYIILISL